LREPLNGDRTGEEPPWSDELNARSGRNAWPETRRDDLSPTGETGRAR